MKSENLVVYVPVIHRGYLELFGSVSMTATVCVLSDDVLKGLPSDLEYIRKKDIIRAVPSGVMVSLLDRIVHRVVLADEKFLSVIHDERIVMPSEDISVVLAEKYFKGGDVTFIPTPKLRYHRNNAEESKLLVPSRRVVISEVDRELMGFADMASLRSPDWYRQVGGVLRASNGAMIVAYNEHQPHEQIAATFGDPRSLFKSGVRTDLSYGDHAEHVLVGEAARLNICTEGATVYLTTFPCLTCGRLLARAGVKRIFYREASYGLLDADEFLRGKKVELIEVSE